MRRTSIDWQLAIAAPSSHHHQLLCSPGVKERERERETDFQQNFEQRTRARVGVHRSSERLADVFLVLLMLF